MLRLFDFTIAASGLILLSPLLAIIFFLCAFDSGHPIFVQTRIGLCKKHFRIYKFRTMKLGTDDVPTHCAKSSSITTLGGLLRKTKLDELPQLYNVLIGDMSMVGPRPCLPLQSALIKEREQLGIFQHRPGITGLAQIRNIDMSTPRLLAETESEMLYNFNLTSYFKYITFTIIGAKNCSS